ncbi:MAG: DUF6600 domain-containing protein, partial [Stellaceae bacterium]
MAARFLTAFTAALLLVSPNLWAQSQAADPPDRVGRLSAIEGTVQQRTPDDNDWVQANLNYPVTTGFALAPQENGRGEIQVGSMALRVGPQSELDVTNLGDRDASLTLAQGELNLRVGELPRGERIEVVTPRGVMEILAAGQYHIDAGTTDDPTRFEVFNGRAQVQRDGGNTDLASGQAALISPDNSLNMASAQPDPLDQWALARDQGPAPRTNTASAPPPQSASAPYVSPEMTGEADLSAYGNWSANPDYGNVWYPSGVPSGWAPYTDGHWAWVSPWGWTWIDDEPWGFAPFHYGRWAYLDGGWGWIPGEVAVAPVYAPALVVFIGGSDHRFFWDRDHEGVGWFPLGPHEAYVPGYRTSINYVRNVNRTNVDVRNLNIRRANDRWVVNNGRGDTVNNFANHRFATVVPANQFGQTRRVRDVAIHNASITTAAASLPVSHNPSVTPPRNAAVTNGANHAAMSNRNGRPPLPQARTSGGVQPGRPGTASSTNAPTRTVAGHALPALPPAHGKAGGTGSSAPGRFGASARTPTPTTNRGLPPVPSARGSAPSASNHGPQGTAVNNAAPTGRAARGPFGATRPNATTPSTGPSVTSGSAGRRGLSQMPTTRQQTMHPPAPQPHIAEPPTTNTSAGHRGLSAPSTPSFQRNTAAPTHTFSAPPRPQAPVHTAAPVHNFTPPPRPQPQMPTHTAAPARSFAPPARPAPTPHVAAPV